MLPAYMHANRRRVREPQPINVCLHACVCMHVGGQHAGMNWLRTWLQPMSPFPVLPIRPHALPCCNGRHAGPASSWQARGTSCGNPFRASHSTHRARTQRHTSSWARASSRETLATSSLRGPISSSCLSGVGEHIACHGARGASNASDASPHWRVFAPVLDSEGARARCGRRRSRAWTWRERRASQAVYHQKV